MDDDPPVPPDLVRSVIAQNERFVVGTLRPALAEAECVQQQLETQLNDVQKLRLQLTGVRSNVRQLTPLHTKLDLGGGVLVDAEVPDPSNVCVHVGLGVWPKLTLDEALNFLDRKEAALTQPLERAVTRVNDIQANLYMMNQTLEQLKRTLEL